MNEPKLHTRREFLRRGLTVAAVGITAPSFLTRTAYALNNPADLPLVHSRPGVPDDPILVVLQMAGGNDGLNTLVPYGMDDYYRVRPTLAVPKDQVLRINDEIGMNPALADLKSLYDDGHMAIIQGVGYPNPNRSHFRSMEIWETAADSDKTLSYGWIGRYFDNACSGAPEPMLGVAIGPKTPLTFQNSHQIGVTLQNPNQYRWFPGDGKVGTDAARQEFLRLNTPAPASNGALDFLRHTALNAQVSSDQIRQAAQRYQSTVTYPNDGPLGASLKLIASLIAGGLGTRVFYASITGFDTHANQKAQQPRLLTELAGAVRAFYQDLKAQGNDQKVVLLTFSEFGRRVAENASGGTDHGTANPMFLFGPAIRPGLFGQQPSLTDLDQGDLKFNTDFRSVYATVLEKWLGTNSAAVLGAKHPLLEFI